MKRNYLFTLVVATANFAFGQDQPTTPTLAPGNEVSIEAIASADWLQGNAPTDWEKDKVYLLECWATWCGPCLQVIPHINELHQKFASKGLRVMGMNVWEDGKEKIAKFVQEKGDGMSYPVAFVGRGGEFEQSWLRAAGVRGIPHAFVVKNGKLLFNTHPARISEEIIADLLGGGAAEEKVIEQLAGAQLKEKKVKTLMGDFRKAMQAKDAAAMTTVIAALEEATPDAPYLSPMKIDRAIIAKEWEKAAGLVTGLTDSPVGLQMLTMLGFRAASVANPTTTNSGRQEDPFPETFRKTIASGLSQKLNGASPSPQGYVILAALRWDLGEQQAAKAAAQTAADNPGELPAEPFTAYAKSLEDGAPQTAADVFSAIRTAMQKRNQPQ